MFIIRKLSRLLAFAVLLSIATPQAWATTMIGFDSLDPGEQVTAFPDLGVTFNHTLEAVQCDPNPVVRQGSNCKRARSVDKVVRTLFATEFRRRVADIEFEALQAAVSAYVKLDESSPGLDGEEVVVVMNAFAEGGDFLGSTTVRFTHNFDDGQWHEVGVHSRLGRGIKRVEIWGGLARDFVDPPGRNSATNFLLIDDLTFDTGAPLPEDTEPPHITIRQPLNGDRVVDRGDVDVDLRVFDAVRLATVDMRVVHESGAVISGFSGGIVCGGPGSSRDCPDRLFVETFSAPLRRGLEGRYTLTFRACDAAGNCSEASTSIVLTGPAPAPPITVEAFEVNQGIQNKLFTPGTTPSSNVPLLPGKDTVVRYYLSSAAGPLADFRTPLEVTIVSWNGAVHRRTIFPNTGTTSITVPASPGSSARDRFLLAMRADLTQTLNFVLPGTDLAEVSRLVLRLSDGHGGNFGSGETVEFSRPVVLGIALYHLDGGGVRRLRTSRNDRLNGLKEILKRVYPVSNVVFTNGAAWSTDVIGRLARYRGSSADSSTVYSWVQSTYEGDSVPDMSRWCSSPTRCKTVTLAIVGTAPWAGVLGRGGPPSTAIAYADPNVVPQEIGHTMGITHASNMHAEPGFEPWPYPHGGISPDAVDALSPGGGVFGVIVQQPVPPAGPWSLTLIDPCPTLTFSDRFPRCTLADVPVGGMDGGLVHDFMSYGPFQTYSGGPAALIPPGTFRWTSDITYRRIYAFMRTGAINPPTGSFRAATSLGAAQLSNEARVEALIVAGAVRTDGTAELLLPLTRKPLPRSTLAGESGPYTLELQDGSGNVLLERSFDVSPYSHNANKPFWLAVEYKEGAKKLVVKQQGRVLLVRKASRNPPQVRLLSPNGGEILQAGTRTIKWEGSDADGDPLSFLIQYSPDGGQSWQGITLTKPGSSQEAELRIDEVISGQRGVIRVTASDGFNTSVDQSDGFFSLGTGKPPAGEKPQQPPPTRGSLKLEGNGDYLKIPFAKDLNALDGLTFEAWVKRSSDSRCEAVLGNGWRQSYWLGFCRGPTRFYHGAGQYTDAVTDIPSGQWTHVAVTYDGITSRTYVNGKLDHETTEKAGPLEGTDGLPLFIGGDRDGGYYFQGLIDEVRVWNVVRSQTQIQNAFQREVDGPQPGLLAVWHFNGDPKDAVGNHHGTLVGRATFSTEGFPTQEPLSLAKPRNDRPLRVAKVVLTWEKGRFELSGQNIERVQLQLFNLAGQQVLEQEALGKRLRFPALDKVGRPLANGVYLYVVTVTGYDGQLVRSRVKKLVILR